MIRVAKVLVTASCASGSVTLASGALQIGLLLLLLMINDSQTAVYAYNLICVESANNQATRQPDCPYQTVSRSNFA